MLYFQPLKTQFMAIKKFKTNLVFLRQFFIGLAPGLRHTIFLSNIVIQRYLDIFLRKDKSETSFRN